MRRLLLVAAVASGTVLVGAGPASADATQNDNNCLGAEVSTVLPLPNVFGPAVSALAQNQVVDNSATGDLVLTGASCGDNNSNNP